MKLKSVSCTWNQILYVGRGICTTLVLTNAFQFKLGSADPEVEFVRDDSDDEQFSQAGSKRKRSTKKTNTSSRFSKGIFASASLRPSAAPVYLKSAWKPKALTNRPLVKTSPCQFIRTTASYKSDGQVELQVGNVEETIDISTEWKEGQAGYIGMGFTKRGIYVFLPYTCIGGCYLINFCLGSVWWDRICNNAANGRYCRECQACPWGGIQATLPRSCIQARIRWTCEGPEDFGYSQCVYQYTFLYSINRSLEFYFNFPSSILGDLVPSVSSQSRPLPYRHFLATPLLPCGEADPKIKKFTGNDQIGTAEDHMTQAIHAFAHFSTIYSQKNLLLCDLQGMSMVYLSSYRGPLTFLNKI